MARAGSPVKFACVMSRGFPRTIRQGVSVSGTDGAVAQQMAISESEGESVGVLRRR